MKNTLFIAVILILFNFLGYAQEVNSVKNIEQNSQVKSVQSKTVTKSDYSKQNLQQASIEDLNLYLKKARRLKTTGLVPTIVGPVIFLGGGVVAAASMGSSGIGAILTGLTVTTIGVPILITGSRRVTKVRHALDATAIQNVHISDSAGNNNQNIEPVQDDLNQSLKKAYNLHTTGKVMTIAGSVLIVAGGIMGIRSVDGRGAVSMTGLISTAAGIPLLVSGSKKIKRIENTINTSNRASLSIAPGFVRTNIDNNLYPGINLKVGF